MKKALLTAWAVVLLTGITFAQKTEPAPLALTAGEPGAVPVFTWDKTTHDFGSIPQGKPVTLTYTFTNSGKAPLIISNVIPGCGCTGADFSREAIAPGSKGFVKITYNAAALGVFSKSLTVDANTTPSQVVLNFTGEVVAAPASGH